MGWIESAARCELSGSKSNESQLRPASSAIGCGSLEVRGVRLMLRIALCQPAILSLHRGLTQGSKHVEVYFDNKLDRDRMALEHRRLELVLAHGFDRFLI